VYCDGSAHERSHRPGGWAFVIVRRDRIVASSSGAARSTNNNEMELQAALEGLLSASALGSGPLELVTDSRLTIDVINGTIPPRVYESQGAALRALALKTRVSASWVRGHSGNRWNEHVDALAHAAKLTLVPLRKQGP
jgi:ribonuclease HI